ncbi:hypothetical protein NX059_011578 [Plenodomus lindquistii]|nr:hypothetical protein NX059_011578 [Plenodomus lindquistii]
MSNRDPNLYPCNLLLSTHTMHFSPNAPTFSPSGMNETQQKSNLGKETSTPLSPCLETRVLSLEERHAELQGDVRSLQELYDRLTLSMDKMKKGHWPVRFGPCQDLDVSESHKKAMDFKAELEKLENEVKVSVHGDADPKKADDKAPAKVFGMASVRGDNADPVKVNGNVPPHMRAAGVANSGTAMASLPPHLRRMKKNDDGNGVGAAQSVITPVQDALITDGQIDGQLIPAPVPSPPATPETTAQKDMSTVGDLSLEQAWKPHYIASLPALPEDIRSRLPAGEMVTFHPDFINFTLKGESWSPGLRFMSGPGPHMLRNRTYYMLDPKTEPFLPTAPGTHGAKLTAFFKESPETFHADFEDDACSYDNVPMFVETKDAAGRFRFIYYGNYTQTRWSDKLDHDTMSTKVPESIKQYWAEELTSSARESWVTDALKKHFFPAPPYSGALFPSSSANDDASSIATEVEVKHNADMARDVRRYVEELRAWDREANMKTAMIKKQVILDAFAASDMDEPPALRLWWEYLECVDWRKDFYDLLVTLQSRDKQWK